MSMQLNNQKTVSKYRTKMCVYKWLDGCPYGPRCLYAHTPEELRGDPSAGDSQTAAKFKTKTCKWWKASGGKSCPHGFRCSYLHGYDSHSNTTNGVGADQVSSSASGEVLLLSSIDNSSVTPAITNQNADTSASLDALGADVNGSSGEANKLSISSPSISAIPGSSVSTPSTIQSSPLEEAIVSHSNDSLVSQHSGTSNVPAKCSPPVDQYARYRRENGEIDVSGMPAGLLAQYLNSVYSKSMRKGSVSTNDDEEIMSRSGQSRGSSRSSSISKSRSTPASTASSRDTHSHKLDTSAGGTQHTEVQATGSAKNGRTSNHTPTARYPIPMSISALGPNAAIVANANPPTNAHTSSSSTNPSRSYSSPPPPPSALYPQPNVPHGMSYPSHPPLPHYPPHYSSKPPHSNGNHGIPYSASQSSTFLDPLVHPPTGGYTKHPHQPVPASMYNFHPHGMGLNPQMGNVQTPLPPELHSQPSHFGISDDPFMDFNDPYGKSMMPNSGMYPKGSSHFSSQGSGNVQSSQWMSANATAATLASRGYVHPPNGYPQNGNNMFSIGVSGQPLNGGRSIALGESLLPSVQSPSLNFLNDLSFPSFNSSNADIQGSSNNLMTTTEFYNFSSTQGADQEVTHSSSMDIVKPPSKQVNGLYNPLIYHSQPSQLSSISSSSNTALTSNDSKSANIALEGQSLMIGGSLIGRRDIPLNSEYERSTAYIPSSSDSCYVPPDIIGSRYGTQSDFFQRDSLLSNFSDDDYITAVGGSRNSIRSRDNMSRTSSSSSNKSANEPVEDRSSAFNSCNTSGCDTGYNSSNDQSDDIIQIGGRRFVSQIAPNDSICTISGSSSDNAGDVLASASLNHCFGSMSSNFPMDHMSSHVQARGLQSSHLPLGLISPKFESYSEMNLHEGVGNFFSTDATDLLNSETTDKLSSLTIDSESMPSLDVSDADTPIARLIRNGEIRASGRNAARIAFFALNE